MNFLMNYFQASVHASGYEDLIVKIDNAVARYNGIEIQPTQTEEPVTLTQAIAVASQEAVVEEVAVALPAKKLSNKQLKENAKLAGFMRKQAQESIAFYKQQIAMKCEVEESKKELAELQAFLAQHKHSTDLAFIAAVYAKQGE